MKLLWTLLVCCTGLLTPVWAQDSPTPLSPEQIAARIKPLHPKTLVLVFDVSESTRNGGIFSQERAAAATILREGTQPGDRVVLETFGTGFHTIFDKTLTSAADTDGLIDQLPSSVEPGHGTNIRWPHHEALKLVNKALPKTGVIILLTDSFNDRPLPTDPAYRNYLDYYTLKGLTIYPDTPENRDYERQLTRMKRSGKVRQYGIGVGIAPDGRPIERLPVKPGEGDTPTGAIDLTPTVLHPIGQEEHGSSLPALIAVIVAALVLLGIIAYVLLHRPIPVRLTLGDRGAPRDYRLRPGAKIGLGGPLSAAAPGDDVFPLAGLATPAASIQAARGGAVLIAGPALETLSGLKVFHNGVALEQPSPLRIGDEVHILLPASDSAPPREYRVHFADPRAAEF